MNDDISKFGYSKTKLAGNKRRGQVNIKISQQCFFQDGGKMSPFDS